MEHPNFEHLEKLLEIMRLTYELKGQLKEEDSEEEDFDKHVESSKKIKEEKEKLKYFESDIINMLEWAFKLPSSLEIKKSAMREKWIEYHPDFPPLFIPEYSSDVCLKILLVYQILPYWLEHKKKAAACKS